MDNYYQGETVRQKVHVTDKDGVDIDPSAITISIEDSSGTKKVEDAAMTKDTVGYYYYDYTIPDDGATGEWLTEVNAEKTQIAIEQDRFLVLEALQ